MRKNLLLIGKSGVLGSKFLEKKKELKGYNVIAPSFTELDLRDELKIIYFFNHHDIDVIVNCAAITDIATCETKKGYQVAQEVNNYAVEKLVKHAKATAKFIQISCDQVYKGYSHVVTEDEETWPLNSYGYTKEQADNFLTLNNKENSILIRTQWMYSENSVSTFGRLKEGLMSGQELSVFCDKVGSPTYAGDLVDAIFTILMGEFKPGIYHYTNEGVCTFYDFTYEIAKFFKMEDRVKAIRSIDNDIAKIMPDICVLSKEKIKKEYSLKIPYWRESFEKMLYKILEK